VKHPPAHKAKGHGKLLAILGGVGVLALIYLYVRQQQTPPAEEGGVAIGPPMPVGYGGGGGGGSTTPWSLLPQPQTPASIDPAATGEQVGIGATADYRTKGGVTMQSPNRRPLPRGVAGYRTREGQTMEDPTHRTPLPVKV
jgi:hypothetical protein